MKSRFRTYLAVTTLALIASAGCAPEKPSEAQLRGEIDRSEQPKATAEIEKEPVVVVDGEEITLGEFNRRLQALPEFARARFATIEKKKEYLDSIAQFEVMADVAEEEGLGTRAAVLSAMKDTLAERLLSEVIHERLSMEDIDEAAVEQYYEAHRDDFHTPKARRVALIEFDTRDNAEKARGRILEQMATAEEPIIEFRKAAARYSTDRAVAREGGDIGFVGAPDTETQRPAVAEQAWALAQQGQVTPVFAVDGGWALATFFDERDEHVTPLAEASGEIRNKLYEKRKQQLVDDYVAELRQKATIERHPKVAEGVEAPEKLGTRRAEDIPLRTEEAFETPKNLRSDTVPDETKPTP
ncbi:hypothetical protein FIV42_14670 [Persicimonas caeni]|uniref:PpiC domain-containing protein n=1 Tax=Persicimonas caeni TaxID=2292766 RepID=A0A4Y6PUC7_PERCE|nr:peptidyl-prolyl cis-trans isomerase [Persicimonas caeni]QDG51936.1 hypothetical protein FIV42_14670 [Persicimonas caeni]QED33157.1 hypothetical protein FRD00_14665 [Persicimonas caeni]